MQESWGSPDPSSSVTVQLSQSSAALRLTGIHFPLALCVTVLSRLSTKAVLLSAACLCVDIWRGICILLVKTLKNINVVLFS